MNSFFGFGNEVKQLPKIFSLIKNPMEFFKVNKEKEETLLNFITLIIRASAVINFLVSFIFEAIPLRSSLIKLVIIFVAAKVLAIIGLKVGSTIINFFVKTFSGKNNITAAQRVAAFSSVTSLIPDFPLVLGLVSLLFSITIGTIGISKQYRISYFMAFLTILIPIITVILVVFLFVIYLAYTGVPITLEPVKKLLLS